MKPHRLPFRRARRRFDQWMQSMSLRKKMIAIYVLTALIPMIVLSAYSWYLLRQNLQDQTSKRVDEYLQQSVERINGNIGHISGVMQAAGSDLNIADAFYTEYTSYFGIYQAVTYYVEPFIGSIKATNPEISNLFIITDNPMFVNRASSVILMRGVKDRPWLDAALSSFTPHWVYDQAVGDLSSDAKPQKTLLCMRRMLGTTYGQQHNLLYMEIKLPVLFGTLRPDQPNSGFLITDASGSVVYRVDRATLELSSEHLAAMASTDSNWMRAAEHDWYIVKRPLSVGGLTLTFFTSGDNFTANSGSIVYLAFILFAVSLLLTVLMTVSSSRVVVRRLNALEAKAEQIAHGNFQVDLSTRDNDEIGKLTNIFGRMVVSIRELIDRVYRSELASRDAELKALQAQINPHFLYNVLSLINSMAIKEHCYDVSRLTTRISAHYRSMLSKNAIEIPIMQELDNLKAYVEIQLLLQNGQFDVIYQIDEAVCAYNIIKLVLQPIVENAIEHGLNHMESGRGQIIIDARLSGSGVTFTVEDNGVGIDESNTQDILLADSKGYGLSNVHQRIRYYYGETYGLTIQSQRGLGTIVTVQIPQK